jgi:hypothetical protein
MKASSFLAVVASLFFSLTLSPLVQAQNITLKGNATSNATLELTGGCYVAHNSSPNRKIKFGVGNYSAIVAPKGSHTFVDLAGHCFTSFSPGGPWADYA